MLIDISQNRINNQNIILLCKCWEPFSFDRTAMQRFSVDQSKVTEKKLVVDDLAFEIVIPPAAISQHKQGKQGKLPGYFDNARSKMSSSIVVIVVGGGRGGGGGGEWRRRRRRRRKRRRRGRGRRVEGGGGAAAFSIVTFIVVVIYYRHRCVHFS